MAESKGHVEIHVDGKLVWQQTYKKPKQAGEYWSWGYPPRRAVEAVGAALRRAASNQDTRQM